MSDGGPPLTPRFVLGLGAILASLLSAAALGAARAASEARVDSCPSASPACAADANRVGAPGIGVNFHCTWSNYTNRQRREVLDKLASAGVRWLRIDLGWSTIEDDRRGQRASWYVKRMDRCVARARARGFLLLVTLWRTPDWANGHRGPYVPPRHLRAYARMARWVAHRWRGRVHAWQVWNEPDPSQSFWRGTTRRYAALLKQAYPAFKAGDPRALVVLGGPSYNNDRWIAKLYKFNVRGSFDVLSTHPYQGLADAPPEAPDTGTIYRLTHVPAVRRVMEQHGDGHKPIWFTEFGWSSHPNSGSEERWERGVSPARQGRYYVRTLKLIAGRYPYVTNTFWYTERNDRTASDRQSRHRGLLRHDLSPKPAYRAVKRYLRSR
jgi:polysaccharide biosynthesis protein PslG